MGAPDWWVFHDKGTIMSVLSRIILAVVAAAMLAFGGPAPAAAQAMPAEPRVDVTELLKALPGGGRWMIHLNRDLLPFWTMPEALGNPVGNFPTYRCNDGSLFDPT